MKKSDTIYTCSCGKRWKLTAKRVKSGKEVCPHCGTPVGDDPKDAPALSASDTQMINISEMARMAQEGVDPAASGEWDTSDSRKTGSEERAKKG